MAVFLLCYHDIALWTFKGDISKGITDAGFSISADTFKEFAFQYPRMQNLNTIMRKLHMYTIHMNSEILTV